jgi:hypothetical protein
VSSGAPAGSFSCTKKCTCPVCHGQEATPESLHIVRELQPVGHFLLGTNIVCLYHKQANPMVVTCYSQGDQGMHDSAPSQGAWVSTSVVCGSSSCAMTLPRKRTGAAAGDTQWRHTVCGKTRKVERRVMGVQENRR